MKGRYLPVLLNLTAMKTTVTLIAILFTGFMQSQSLKAWALDASGTKTLEIFNGDNVPYTTTPSAQVDIKIKIKNISSNTNTYSLIREDRVLNPGAAAYFCFGDLGTCYPASTYEPDEYNTLAPGDSTVSGKYLVTYLEEAPSIGYSAIYYKLYNLATGKNGADTLSFTMKYNQLLSVNEMKGSASFGGEIYPNPSGNTAHITVTLPHDGIVKLQIHNSLGIVLYSGAEKLSSGKNKVQLDCSNYSSGLYFITVSNGETRITKRLIINK
jgi:hypothetical protein